jgi:hypothetical protein
MDDEISNLLTELKQISENGCAPPVARVPLQIPVFAKLIARIAEERAKSAEKMERQTNKLIFLTWAIVWLTMGLFVLTTGLLILTLLLVKFA